MMRSGRWVLAAAFVTLSAAWTGAVETPVAAAPSTVVIVIDTGSGAPQVATVDAGGMSGMQALNAVATVVTGFDGAAVCKINGVGNDAGSCLVGPHGEYWAYWRASPGATSWSYSSLGATATSVQGGGVEGWRYGFGQQPRGSVCDYTECAPPPTDPSPPPPTAAPPPPSPTVAPAAPGDGGSTTAPTPSATSAPATKGKGADGSAGGAEDAGADGLGAQPVKGDSAKGDSTTSSDSKSARTTKHQGEGQAALGATGGAHDGGNGSPVGVLIVVGILLAVAAVVMTQQRRRRHAGDP